MSRYALRNKFKLECIPVGSVPPAAVEVKGVSTHPPWEQTPTPWSRHPLGVGLETPQARSPSTSPLVVGLETPLARSPSTSPLGVGLETPLARSPSTSPLGVGLETCKACWDTTRPLGTCCKACWDTTCNACWDSTPHPPPVNRITDTCKNITFPQLRLQAVTVAR